MASKESQKKTPKVEAYPTEPIARDMGAESSRRNIEIVIWYKRLITGTLGLLALSALFTLLAALFAWRQSPPQVYASAQDGQLYRLEGTKRASPEELGELLKALQSESDYKAALGGQRVTVDAAVKAAEAKAAERLRQKKAAEAAAAAAATPVATPAP